MSDKKTGLISYKKNKENPFLRQALEEINDNIVKKYKTASRTGEKAILQAINPETGQIVGHTQFIRQIEVDEQQFTKMYLNNFSAFWGLKSQAIKVFGYIMTKLIPGKDQFIFLMDEAKEHTGYKSDKSIYIGLASLLENEVIARGPADVLFFINPMVAFNGNRVTFAKTYVKKKKKSKFVDPNQTNLLDAIDEAEREALNKKLNQ